MRAADISTALAAQIEALCAHLLPRGLREGAEWRCGSIYGEPGRSMGVHLRGDKAGRWCDFATGEKGDALGLVAAVLGLDMVEAVRWARDWLGISGGGRGGYSRVHPRIRTGGKAVDSGQAEQRRRARWLWSQGKPIAGTIAETYLREARGYRVSMPATLRFLPARGDHVPAMIAPFGIPSEPEPGRLTTADNEVVGVHITKLKADGSGKAGTKADKIMIAKSVGSPIVLAPANDLLGMAITEGIEDGLSIHQITGLGVWAAGSAARMPGIAAAIPTWIECVTIVADDDFNGRRYAAELASRLADRGIHTNITLPGIWKTAA
jgi:hypothetical protein